MLDIDVEYLVIHNIRILTINGLKNARHRVLLFKFRLVDKTLRLVKKVLMRENELEEYCLAFLL